MGIKSWQKTPLKALCSRIGDGLHGTPTYEEDSNIFFINGNNLKHGKIELNENTKTVTTEDFERNYIELNQNTLLLGINGSIGSMAFYNNEKVMLGKSAAYLNFKSPINRFYFYYFQLKDVQQYFYNVATGSTIKNLSLKSIQDFEVPYPDKSEWSKIAKVLSDLDAKIELNNKINAELEGMAKLIYDYWFVQFEFPNSPPAEGCLPEADGVAYSPPAEGCPQGGVGDNVNPITTSNSITPNDSSGVAENANPITTSNSITPNDSSEVGENTNPITTSNSITPNDSSGVGENANPITNSNSIAPNDSSKVGENAIYTQNESTINSPQLLNDTEAPKYGKVKRNSKNFFSLPYNPKLKERAKELRKAGNLAEVLFWKQVRNGNFKGLDFDRQKIIGNYIVDFYCPNYQLVVEIDGSSHNDKQEYDAKRDAYLESLGLKVIHFTDKDVKQNISHVMRCLEDDEIFKTDALEEPAENYRQLNDLQAEQEKNLPAFQAPLQGRGTQGRGYKSSGGRMVYNEELKREIPEGWEVGTLESIGQIIGGSTPSKAIESNFCSNEGMPWITPKDLSRNTGNKYITRGEFDVTEMGLKEASLKVMPKGTVLLSSRAPIGYLAIAREDVTTNQGFKSFVPKDYFSTEYIYYTIKNSIKEIEANSSGSTFKEVSSSTLKLIKTILPTKIIIEEYNRIIQPIFKKQDNLEIQNEQLSSLRDWLLPMLMNGQVTVKGAYEKMEDVELGVAAEGEGEYK